MEILYITSDEEESRRQLAEALKPYGVNLTHLRASENIFGTFVIASALKRKQPDAVVANSPGLLYNAIAARKMTDYPTLPVMALIDANAERPRGVTESLRLGVAKWIFPSQQHADAYPADLRSKVVCPIPALGIEDVQQQPRSGEGATTYLWVGAIDGSTATLRQAIRDVAEIDGATMVICGQGKARHTMPAVQECRRMPRPEAYRWTGEALSPEKAVELVRTVSNPQIVCSSFDPTPLETTLAWCTGQQPQAPEELIQALARELKDTNS